MCVVDDTCKVSNCKGPTRGNSYGCALWPYTDKLDQVHDHVCGHGPAHQMRNVDECRAVGVISGCKRASSLI